MSRQFIAIALCAVAIAAIAFYSGRRSAPAQGSLTEARADVEKAAISAKEKMQGTATAKAKLAGMTSNRMLDSAVSNPSEHAPLPPAGTQLKSILADLKARADAGDADAASRLFKDMQTCAEVQRLNQTMPGMANRVLNNTSSDPRSGRMLDFVQRNLDFTKNNAAMCADLSADDMANLVPATLQAAQLGDPQAANCYVGANLNNWPGLVNNPQWVQDYQTNALNLANSALQQGDWSMAMLMAQAYGGSSRNMLNQITGTSAVQAYTYAKLMSLGQPTGTQQSQRSTNALSNFSGQLTPDQIQAADQQAQQMYQQYFNNTPRQTGQIASANQACQGSGPGF
ncbi:hypothetical protein [Rudaea cellulosilytica]|uniref:hypothetical protein n=1 Tax=Rudaea cellulosilytica TaxID=540746 RepID=UPI0012FA15E1|nr:hypothetical protein [Rudaea cellulosilytica]